MVDVHHRQAGQLVIIILYLHVNVAGCRMKIHAEHINEGEGVAACKLHADRARELLLLAPAAPDQRRWVARLARRVQRYGYRAAHHTNHDHTKLSPRYSELSPRYS